MDSNESENIEGGELPVEAPIATQRFEGEELVALIEALILSHGEALEIERIAQIAKCSEDQVCTLLQEVQERHGALASGFELVCVGGRYQFRTKGKFADHVRELKASRPRRLTPAALETLSVIAYRQPIVKSDIEKIRGVDATPTLKTLLERGLIKIVGHQATPGQPALYGSTDEFLNLFGLSSLAELPTLRDIRELERDPGEIEETGEDTSEEYPTADGDTHAVNS